MKKASVSWTLSTGKTVVVIVEAIKKLENKRINADGDIVILDEKELFETQKITATIDNKIVSYASEINYCVPANNKGVVAVIDKLALTQDKLEMVEAAIKEADEAEETEEIKKYKNDERITKEKMKKTSEKLMEQEKRERKNGLCPKCNTYCYGDCND